MTLIHIELRESDRASFIPILGPNLTYFGLGFWILCEKPETGTEPGKSAHGLCRCVYRSIALGHRVAQALQRCVYGAARTRCLHRIHDRPVQRLWRCKT